MPIKLDQMLESWNNPSDELIDAFPVGIGAMQLTQAPNGESKIEVTMSYDRYVPEDTIASSVSAIGAGFPKSLIG